MKKIRVVALREGYYNHVLVEKGKVFKMNENEVKDTSWVKRYAPDLVKVVTEDLPPDGRAAVGESPDVEIETPVEKEGTDSVL